MEAKYRKFYFHGVQTRYVITVLLSLWLTACGSASSREPVDLADHCQDMVNVINALELRVKLPPGHLVEGRARREGDFDVNQYFSILDQLSMQDGFVLDYVYFGGQIGGEPILYPRRSDQPAFQTYAELTAAEGDLYTWQSSAFHTSIHVVDAEVGFLQFVILKVLANQFYLDWHANYNDDIIICNREDLEAVILNPAQEEFDLPGMTNWAKWRARRLRPETQVIMQTDEVVVKIVIFTKWGGFIRRTYTISRQFPHTIIDIQNKTLVFYDCGIIY